jgi:predicted HTH transcriptional regulator
MAVPTCRLITNHGLVLACIADNPQGTALQVANKVSMSHRTIQRIIRDLVVAGYLSKEKVGRGNRYHINLHLPLPDPGQESKSVATLLSVLQKPTP